LRIAWVFAAAGTNLARDFDTRSSIAIIIATTLLSIGVIITSWARLRGHFSSGTIFPYILQGRTEQLPEKIKEELLDALSRSHYYNYRWHVWRGRFVGVGGALQIFGMLLLVAVAIAEALRSIH
jgi:hypothetical protein